MGHSGMFRGAGIDIQLEEVAHVIAISVSFSVPAASDVGSLFEFIGGASCARIEFDTRENALRFARRLAVTLGVSGSAYGSGIDALALEPALEVAPDADVDKPV